MRSFLLFILYISIQHIGLAQSLIYNSKSDSLDYASTIEMDELVITGQFEPQSLENSVYKVKVIDKAKIESMGATSLNEVLTNEINIRISQDLAIGNSSLNFQGIGGNNVKILIDGVPVVGRNGNGNDVDLNQINLRMVEKIEIVEGPMAVNFGANALAGVINIITKKEDQHKTSVQADIQEETAGNEYGLDKGRHIQNLKINHKITDHFHAQIYATHNDFKGYQGNMEGRQQEWNPKDQFFLGGMIGYSGNDFQTFYKVDFMDEKILQKGQSRSAINPEGERYPYAFDEEYNSNRQSHHLQLDGKLKGLRYSLTTSYSHFKRIKYRYSENLSTGNQTITTGSGDQDTSRFESIISRSALTKTLGENLSLQFGHDFTFDIASGGRISGKQRNIYDYGFYASVEYLPADWMKLRPGLRYAYNTSYETPLLPSLNAKMDLADHTDLRMAYGRGYRSPTTRELYFEFVDSNHRIFGNTELQPEFSHHLEGNISNNSFLGKAKIYSSAGVFYNDIDNLISYSQSQSDPTATTYINIYQHKTLGFNLEGKFSINRFIGGIGFAYTGRYNRASETDSISLKSYFWSPEFTGNLSYAVQDLGLHFNLFYKFYGQIKTYVADENDELAIGEQEGYHWMDLTCSKTIGQSFSVNAGVKNVLNVSRILNSTSGGVHSGGSTLPISYGRSYFLKINYTLNI